MIAIVKQLADCEDLVARIYAAYARQFPDRADFWSDLSRDELEHGRLVRFLADGISSGVVSFSAAEIRPQSIQMFHSYLHGQAVRAETETLAAVTALSIALNIEKSILEADYFRRFKGTSLMASAAIRQLQEDTIRHRNVVAKEWEGLRRFT